MEQDFDIGGSCLCKAHSFKIDVRKVRFGFASCHCTVCRRSHGAPFVMWAGMDASNSTPDIFQLNSADEAFPLTEFKSTETCSRYFCPSCGTHLYLKYDQVESGGEENRWSGEIHFPTALLDEISCSKLEEAMKKVNRPRYLHVFASQKHPCLGNLEEWATAPKYGGVTGLEPLDS
jgi:hypothetical protein